MAAGWDLMYRCVFLDVLFFFVITQDARKRRSGPDHVQMTKVNWRNTKIFYNSILPRRAVIGDWNMYSGKYNIMLNFQPPSFSESTVKNGYNLLWSFVHDTALNILNEAYLVSQVTCICISITGLCSFLFINHKWIIFS